MAVEPVSTTLAVVGLAALVTTCVDCFEYIQFGRQFGKDFQGCLATIDVVKIRFERWAASVGAFQDGTDTQTSLKIAATEKELKTAKALLGDILIIFEDVQRVSQRFKLKAEEEDQPGRLLVYDHDSVDSGLEPSFEKLHKWSLAVTKMRQKRTGVGRKISWALYEKKHFERLIDDIKDKVESLETVFPAAEKTLLETRQQLCTAEISELKDSSTLALLQKTARDNDKLLLDMVSTTIAKGHTWGNTKVRDSAFLNQGDQLAVGATPTGNKHKFGDTDVSGHAIASQGDRVGMPDFMAAAITARNERLQRQEANEEGAKK
jgi:Prion-inhibition and propagation